MLVSRVVLVTLGVVVVLFFYVLFGMEPLQLAREDYVLDATRWLGAEFESEENERQTSCPQGTDKIVYVGHDIKLGKDVCAETCAGVDAFDLPFEPRMRRSSASTCVAAGFTLFYRATPSHYISVVPMFDVYVK